MYLGHWHGSQVAIKILNPAMIGLEYRTAAAWLNFLQDANRMGALRHPNLVEVYGVVLPPEGATAAALVSGSRPASGGAGMRAAGSWPQVPERRLSSPLARSPALVMEFVSWRSLR
jgi:serine/threonine protein kinase